jgi:hypothetical protein
VAGGPSQFDRLHLAVAVMNLGCTSTDHCGSELCGHVADVSAAGACELDLGCEEAQVICYLRLIILSARRTREGGGLFLFLLVLRAVPGLRQAASGQRALQQTGG